MGYASGGRGRDRDRVVLLHKGRVRFAGRVADLLELAQERTLRSAFMRVTDDARATEARP
jgi:ABC-type Na+ transport system ATPase subunit NatA